MTVSLFSQKFNLIRNKSHTYQWLISKSQSNSNGLPISDVPSKVRHWPTIVQEGLFWNAGKPRITILSPQHSGPSTRWQVTQVSLIQHRWGTAAVWQTLLQTLEEAVCLAQALPPHLAPWDLRGYHSDNKNESEMLSILSEIIFVLWSFPLTPLEFRLRQLVCWVLA